MMYGTVLKQCPVYLHFWLKQVVYKSIEQLMVHGFYKFVHFCDLCLKVATLKNRGRKWLGLYNILYVTQSTHMLRNWVEHDDLRKHGTVYIIILMLL